MDELSFLLLIFSLICIILSILAIESKKVFNSITYLWIFSLSIGMIFFILSAYFAAIFQFFLYGGVLTVLFLVFIMLYEKEKKLDTNLVEEDQNVLSSSEL